MTRRQLSDLRAMLDNAPLDYAQWMDIADIFDREGHRERARELRKEAVRKHQEAQNGNS